MTSVSRSALVPYTPAQMFDVVNDVENYRRFLPWCSASRVLSETDTEMVATLEISKSGLSQSFTTRNSLNRPNSITLALIDGPFSSLDGRWSFEPAGNCGEGCRVSLQLTFKMGGGAFQLAVGKVFGVAADKMVDAFCERAEYCYE